MENAIGGWQLATVIIALILTVGKLASDTWVKPRNAPKAPTAITQTLSIEQHHQATAEWFREQRGIMERMVSVLEAVRDETVQQTAILERIALVEEHLKDRAETIREELIRAIENEKRRSA